MAFERNILAQFHRKGQILWTRSYKKLDNAIPRAIQILMTEGQPGDVVEFSHANGLQLGTVKVRAGGKMETWYVWD